MVMDGLRGQRLRGHTPPAGSLGCDVIGLSTRHLINLPNAEAAGANVASGARDDTSKKDNCYVFYHDGTRSVTCQDSNPGPLDSESSICRYAKRPMFVLCVAGKMPQAKRQVTYPTSKLRTPKAQAGPYRLLKNTPGLKEGTSDNLRRSDVGFLAPKASRHHGKKNLRKEGGKKHAGVPTTEERAGF
ncbi:hypothetical protein Bbelb_252380 [Branchiostoma belcheri]|nr:hypothetical protein Bbelb_252380 [Branchiostoma belcheri]